MYLFIHRQRPPPTGDRAAIPKSDFLFPSFLSVEAVVVSDGLLFKSTTFRFEIIV